MKLISKITRDSDNSTAKVYSNAGDKYTVQFYNKKGMLLGAESYPGKTARYHEDSAENWALGIKKLPL
jgi:hypothetical protein